MEAVTTLLYTAHRLHLQPFIAMVNLNAEQADLDDLIEMVRRQRQSWKAQLESSSRTR